MKVRLHEGRTDPPVIAPLLRALDLVVIPAGSDRSADIALWNLSASPHDAAAELSEFLIQRDPDRLPRVVLVPAGQEQLERRAYEAGVDVVVRRPLSASLLLGAIEQRGGPGYGPPGAVLPQLVLLAGADEEILEALSFVRLRDDLVVIEAREAAAMGAALRQFAFDACVLAERLDGPGSASSLFARMRRTQPDTTFLAFDLEAEEGRVELESGRAMILEGPLDPQRVRAAWEELTRRVDRVRSTLVLHGEIADKQRELQRVNATLRNINKAFRDANIRLEREGLVKDELIGVAAHELKSPLAAMKGALDMLGGDRPDLAADDLMLVGLLKRNTARMIKLVEDILDLSRIEAGRMMVNRRPVSPASIIDQAVQTLRLRALEKGIRFEVDEGPGEMVEVDGERLAQMLINLLDNAVKFSPPAGIVRVLVRVTRGEIHFVVSDSGPGIPAEERERVFEHFHHRARGQDPHSGGSGLGLTITRALAALQGGSVTLGESPSGGARFVVSLPLRL